MKLKIQKNKLLSSLTTFKIGGRSKFFCEPKNLEELIELIKFAKKNNLNIFILGGGSNVLISDSGFDGLTISMKRLNKIFVEDNFIVAESGVLVKKVNKIAMKYSLSGLEFSSGLPGSVGGAVYMNARAYGGEFSNVVDEVVVVDYEGNVKILVKKDLDYSYKKSIFMKEPLVIYKVKLSLKKDNRKRIIELYKKNYEDRKKKGQFKYPSAGCVFKNDYNINLVCGKLLDEMGLKGTRIGGAIIPDFHANFIVNYKKARAEDVKKLIEMIEEKVYEKKGIKLEREIKLVGF